MSELKPCPFCKAELFSGTNVHKKAVMRHPYNPKCPLSEAQFLDTPGFRESWNRRPEPANAPLTLDELRGMDGEEIDAYDLSPVSETLIVDAYDCSASSKYQRRYFDNDSYGKTWLAYRRKPEGSESQ